jgi:phage terminase large subunit
MHMTIKMQATNVLQRTLEAAELYKILCEEGGSRSSKTYSIFQFFILKALANEMKTLTIARSKLTWIKATLLKDFAEITESYGIPVYPTINPNRPEQIYYINGVEFAFFGLDYPQKLHGRKQDWVWLNEVMEIDRKSFDQLEMRTSGGIILDYNPSDDSHWVFDLQKRPDVTVIKSTMLDNPFLPESIIKKIKGYEPTEENIRNGTADSYMWEVYGLGNKARLEGAVFTNWDVVDEIPKDAKLKGLGLDFGYTNDPTALVELYIFNNEIYLNELIYQKGMLNSDIASSMEKLETSKSATIWADSSEPKSIDELVRYGFDVKAVDKGPDSINYGIDIMKGYKIHITKRSINLENEFRKYKWAEDKNGRTLNKPIDAFNHGIDAARYAAMMLLGKKPEVTIDWI